MLPSIVAKLLVYRTCQRLISQYRKQLDALTEFVKKPQIGAKGMVYARIEADGTVKSSVDKFYTQEVLQLAIVDTD